MNKFKYSLNQSVKFFKVESRKHRLLRFLPVDLVVGISLIILADLLPLSSSPAIGIAFFLLKFFGVLILLSPLLPLLGSCWYFILTLILPVEGESGNTKSASREEK